MSRSTSTNKWFKHYNLASEGQLIGDLIEQKRYDAVTLWWILLEIMSQFEDYENRGTCTISVARIARKANMKPSKIQRLLVHISSVSRSDLICSSDEKQPSNVTFRLPKWLELQENRGGKRKSKQLQNPDRYKIEDKRCKIKEKEKEKTPVFLIEPSPIFFDREKRISAAENFEAHFKFNFPALFARYPRFQKRTESLVVMATHITDDKTYAEVGLACDAYKAYCRRENIEMRHMLTFPKWWEEWRDWLNPLSGTTDIETGGEPLDFSSVVWNGADGDT